MLIRLLIPALLLASVVNPASAQQSIDTSIRSTFRLANTRAGRENKINNLFLLGKIWGFLKYYHPSIAAGKCNWDKELLEFLPEYSKVNSAAQRNFLLETWLEKFAVNKTCKSCNDSLLKGARLQPDFSWINEKNFSGKIIQILFNTKANRLEDEQYYLKAWHADDVNIVQFRNENSYGNIAFPSDAYALLSLFRFWNVIEYWYPYKYGMPLKWDDVLKKFIPEMLACRDERDYILAVEELVASLRDSHGFLQPNSKINALLGKYYMPFTVRLIEQKLIVTSVRTDSSGDTPVKAGDIIETINDTSVAEIIKRMEPFCPASNQASLQYKMSYRLTRTNAVQTRLGIKRNSTSLTVTVKNYIPGLFKTVDLNPPFFTLQRDSSFCIINKKIGYINVGNFNRKDSLALKAMVERTDALVIDNRQNQDEEKGTGGGDIIGKIILPPDSKSVRISYPQPAYPGVFTLGPASNAGLAGNPGYYKGKIVILANEATQSVGEILTMAYRKAPGARILGTATAGADGNVTYIMLPGNIFVQFTGLGVYYPDGSETQRAGIKPDIIVRQTIAGYQNNKDEQLEAALEYLEKGRMPAN